MKGFSKTLVAILVCVLVVIVSTAVSVSVKLNKECEKVIDTFYEGKLHNGYIVSSIYADIVKMYELAESIVVVADNYGIDTRKLVSDISTLREELSYKNPDASDLYEDFTNFYNNLWAVELELSTTQLSQRHLEYMNSAAQQVNNLKLSIENSEYNSNVKSFYKKFDRFPANAFADMFDIEYPEYFA